MRRRIEIGIVVGVVLEYLLFAAFTLTTYPPVYSDEPWLMSTPVSLLRHGSNALPMFGEHYNASFYWDVYLVPFLAVLGVSVEAGRITAVLHGAGVLVLVWLVARELGARRTAWLAPVLLAVLYPFVEATRYVRPESVELFYGLLALFLYLRGRTRGLAWSAAAGVCAGVAFGVFFQAAWVVVILAVWAALDWRSSRSRVKSLAGGFAGALLPLVIFIAQDPGDYRRFLHKFGNSSIFGQRYVDRGPFGTLWSLVSSEWDRYDRYLTTVDSRLYVAILLVVVAAAVAALRLPQRWRLLPLLAAAPVVLALLAANKTPAYLVVVAPGLAIAAAVSLDRSPRWCAPALAVLVGVGYAAVVHDQFPPAQTSWTSVRSAYRALPIPSGSVVIGLPLDWGYFMNRDDLQFRSVHVLTHFDDFQLDSAAEARAQLDREARGRRLFLLQSPALMSTLASFSANGEVSPGLVRLLHDRFRPIRTLTFTGTPYGDFSDTLTEYRPP